MMKLEYIKTRLLRLQSAGKGKQMNKAIINDEIYKSWKNSMYNLSWLRFKHIDSWT